LTHMTRRSSSSPSAKRIAARVFPHINPLTVVVVHGARKRDVAAGHDARG
jgi:hypothetical protein